MILLLISLLLFGGYCPIFAQQPPPVRCTGDNQQVQQNNAIYWCSGGRARPVACLASDGSRVEIGSSYWTDKAIVECRQASADVIQLVTVACLKNGRRVEPDQTFNDGTYFYKCTRNANDMSLTATGCVGADGAQVAPGANVNKGSFVYICSLPGQQTQQTSTRSPAAPGPPAASTTTKSPQLKPVGCMFNGRQYDMGADMELSGAWYKCTKDANGAPTSVLTGCVVNNTKYAMNKTWQDEFFAFRCEKMGGFVMSNTYACVERYPNGTVSEYAPGRKWMVGSGDFNRYIISCTKEGIQLRRRGVACYYMTNEGRGVLNSGCMKNVGGILIQCSQPGPTPNVRIRITENPTPADVQRLQGTGLRLCESVPLESVIN